MSEPKPVLIYDGHCGFCRIWLDYWRQLIDDRIECVASQDVGHRFPQIAREAYAQSVQLVRPDGSVVSGARAVFESLGKTRIYTWISVPSELAYRIIARHRDFFYQVTRFTFGTRIEPTQFAATQWLFLRAIALIYAVAFGSLTFQITGLLGERGILPVAPFLASVARTDATLRFIAVPSLLWFGNDDITLIGLCFAGVIFACMLLLTGFARGKFERLILVVLFVLYLSFAAAGQEFLSFQWDSLLVEAGFLAIFLGRNRIVPWLFRWLVFRLYFLSGAVKLLSADPTWRNLSALSFHWHTQPLPTPLAWYVDKLPPAIQHFLTGAALGIEVVIPFLIFFPRRIRMFGAWCLIVMQVAIMITGNYGFFNLLDDRTHALPFRRPRAGAFRARADYRKIAGSATHHESRARRRFHRHCSDDLESVASVRDFRWPPAPGAKCGGPLHGAAADRQHLRIVRRDDHAAHRDHPRRIAGRRNLAAL